MRDQWVFTRLPPTGPPILPRILDAQATPDHKTPPPPTCAQLARPHNPTPAHLVLMGSATCSASAASGFLPETCAACAKPMKASMARRPFLSSFTFSFSRSPGMKAAKPAWEEETRKQAQEVAGDEGGKACGARTRRRGASSGRGGVRSSKAPGTKGAKGGGPWIEAGAAGGWVRSHAAQGQHSAPRQRCEGCCPRPRVPSHSLFPPPCPRRACSTCLKARHPCAPSRTLPPAEAWWAHPDCPARPGRGLTPPNHPRV